MFKTISKNQFGVTLIELVIALSIFGVIMIIATDSFINIIRVNRESVNAQNLQDHTRFLYEMMLKEIKMAKINHNNTCSSFAMDNMIYKVNSSNDTLYFKNYHNECVVYKLDDTVTGKSRLKIKRNNNNWVDVFPQGINVKSINFNVVNLIDTSIDTVQHFPPAVTITMELESDMWQEPVLQVQSTVSARYIE